MKSMRAYIQRSILTIVRIFVTYRPLKFFTWVGSVPVAAGVILGLRWLYYFSEDPTRARVPSLILAAIFLLVGVQLWILGLIADIIAVNRKMLEEIQLRVKRIEYR